MASDFAKIDMIAEKCHVTQLEEAKKCLGM